MALAVNTAPINSHHTVLMTPVHSARSLRDIPCWSKAHNMPIATYHPFTHLERKQVQCNMIEQPVAMVKHSCHWPHHIIGLLSHRPVEVGRACEVQQGTGQFSVWHYNNVQATVLGEVEGEGRGGRGKGEVVLQHNKHHKCKHMHTLS